MLGNLAHRFPNHWTFLVFIEADNFSRYSTAYVGSHVEQLLCHQV
jgi:hypothetical protein